MKKKLIIICTVFTAFGLMATSYMKPDTCVQDQKETRYRKTVFFNTDLASIRSEQAMTEIFYAIDSRFATTITKEALHRATSILDIIPKKATQDLSSYKEVKVAVFRKGMEIAELGVDEELNEAQLKLLKTADHSTDFYITADCKQKRAEAREHEKYDLVYYITVVPEKEAVYQEGKDALLTYVKDKTAKFASSILEDDLQPGKIRFMVTAEGTVADVHLESTSGLEALDKEVLDLITNMPGSWAPAKDSKGEKVKQEFVFSFGTIGC